MLPLQLFFAITIRLVDWIFVVSSRSHRIVSSLFTSERPIGSSRSRPVVLGIISSLFASEQPTGSSWLRPVVLVIVSSPSASEQPNRSSLKRPSSIFAPISFFVLHMRQTDLIFVETPDNAPKYVCCPCPRPPTPQLPSQCDRLGGVRRWSDGEIFVSSERPHVRECLLRRSSIISSAVVSKAAASSRSKSLCSIARGS